MAKKTGLGITSLNVDDSGGTPQDIVNDITNFAFSTPRGVQDVTGVDRSAFERLLLLVDFSGTLNGVFNPAVAASHDVFSDVADPSADDTRTLAAVHSGQTLTGEVLLTDYPLTRAQSGELTWAVPFVLADGTPPAWS